MTKKNVVSRNQSNELMIKLEAAGLNKKSAQTEIENDDNRLAQKVVSLINRGGLNNLENYQPVVDYLIDKSLMTRFPSEILEKPDPWEPKKLVKDTHFVFLGIREIDRQEFNLNRLIQSFPGPEHPKIVKIDWGDSDSKKLGLTICRSEWYVMRIGPVPRSKNLTFEDQVAILPSNYEVPLLIERILANVFYYQNNGVYLDSNCDVRCSDILPYWKTTIGVTESGLVRDGVHESSYPELGISASRIL